MIISEDLQQRAAGAFRGCSGIDSYTRGDMEFAEEHITKH